MPHKYPRIGSKQKERGRKCLVCTKRTTGKVTVQFSHMRGDDEVAPVCELCQVLPNLLDRMLESWRKENANAI